jgi:hypothetical protein
MLNNSDEKRSLKTLAYDLQDLEGIHLLKAALLAALKVRLIVNLASQSASPKICLRPPVYDNETRRTHGSNRQV